MGSKDHQGVQCDDRAGRAVFGAFRLEPAKRRLLREGEPLSLTPKAFDMLVLLVENRERLVAPLPGALQDVSREGGVLLTMGRRWSGIAGRAPGDAEERELSWLEGSAASDLSPDGQLELFGEMLEGGGMSGRIYLRRTDGSPAVHLGDGHPHALSPDGRWALCHLDGSPDLTLVTGPGEPRTLRTGGLDDPARHPGRARLRLHPSARALRPLPGRRPEVSDRRPGHARRPRARSRFAVRTGSGVRYRPSRGALPPAARGTSQEATKAWARTAVTSSPRSR